MTETHNIEYKQDWRDEYLKWVCGFANANGGIIYIGKDDNGDVVGVSDYKRLMEEIPNKIQDVLGLVVEVNLKKFKQKPFIEIIVPSYSVPISYKGSYYYRSGSTKRELTGNALNEFLLKKTGQTWDEVVLPDARISDIDRKSVEIFLDAAAQAKRFPVDRNIPLKMLLEKLQLTEKGKIKRAAIVLFGKNTGKYFPSMRIQIGRFGASKVDLRFQETVESNLILSLQETLDQLDRKFLISPVSFEGLHRIESWQYPLPALREVLLNALIHRNYMGAHTQIAVYDDRISFWNNGGLPEALTLQMLKKDHASYPRNPLIAGVCFKGGYIDSWGRGIKKILDACYEADFPEPVFEENTGGVLVTLSTRKGMGDYALTPEATPEVTPEVAPEVLAMLKVVKGEMSRQEIQNALSLSDEKHFREYYQQKAVSLGFIEMTIPDKPKSSKQKYRLTEKGKQAIKNV